MRNDASTVQSVDRAVSLLQALAAHGPAGLTELSAGVRIHKATAFRLLSTLEARGLVQQDGERGRYRLGPSAAQLARRAAQSRVPDGRAAEAHAAALYDVLAGAAGRWRRGGG